MSGDVISSLMQERDELQSSLHSVQVSFAVLSSSGNGLFVDVNVWHGAVAI